MVANKKLLIFTAPSGAGKTTIVRHLLTRYPALDFSISATTRARRHYEKEGVDYYFISIATFNSLIEENAFVEWEEVYEGQFYGTLRKELERLWSLGKSIIFDIDVKGALNLKRQFQEDALTIFIKTPSPEILFDRLRKRQTEDMKSLQKRIDKATHELTFEQDFDKVLINDDLKVALREAEQIVEGFINQ
ncbi:MAG: guanylate kinase [Saprospiraceae bacterium]